jgi:hypothetical protein
MSYTPEPIWSDHVERVIKTRNREARLTPSKRTLRWKMSYELNRHSPHGSEDLSEKPAGHRRVESVPVLR